MKGARVSVELRDEVVDFVTTWSGKTQRPVTRLVREIGIAPSKFFDWRARYGRENRHNAAIPRDHWLAAWEKAAILTFYLEHSEEGYRRVAYMMLDRGIVAVSPSSVYRVLVQAGVLRKWSRKDSRKGNGFEQPVEPHEHWHMDISYINMRGTFYYLCSILDGCSRYIVHHEIREQMKEEDVEIILQRALEKYPGVHPRIISDNGPQFIARDFKEFVRIHGMDHVRTSPYYPQSNGKIERWQGSLKQECIRPKTPLTLDDAQRVTGEYVEHYNTQRLHSAIGYITPMDRLEGRHIQIHEQRKRKMAEAREARRQTARENQEVFCDAVLS